jgi:LysR family nitrogen assimilation transcriptional regulator
VRLHVHEGISLDLERLVQEGRIDCACVIDLETSGSIVSEPIFCEQLFLVGPVSAGLRPDVPALLADVADMELILTTRPNSLRLIVEEALAQTSKPYRIVADFNATGFMIELVKRGMAVSVLPYSAAWAAVRSGELTVAPIRDLTIDWVLIARRDRPPSLAASLLGTIVREVARRRIDSGEWLSAQLAPVP